MHIIDVTYCLGMVGVITSPCPLPFQTQEEVFHPPDTLVIRGKASDMRGSDKTTRNGSWEGASLASIVKGVAARNGWESVCSVDTVVPRAGQLGESDCNFITRMSKQFHCTAMCQRASA